MRNSKSSRVAESGFPGLFLAVAILVALLCHKQAFGQTDPAPQATQQETNEQADEIFAAPVTFEGRTLFLVRGSSVLPAEERVVKIEERLAFIAETSSRPQIEVEINVMEFGHEILIDGSMATVVTDADAEFEQMDLNVLAALQAEALEDAILEYRKSRSSEARVDSALAAFGWTIAFLLISFAFFRGRRLVATGAGRFTERHLTKVETATKSIVRGKAVGSLAQYFANLVLWITFFALIYFYLSFVLLSFAETRPLAELLLVYVSEPFFGILWGIVAYLPNLITLVIIAVVTRYIIRGLRIVMDNVAAGTFQLGDFEPHWVAPTINIARVVVIAVAVVFAYPYLPGADSAAFQGLTILAGIMVSLGSNSVISNMMAGIFVIYRRSTNIGDRIQVGNRVGDVVEIKLMETLIKSVKNEMISIPNAQLLNSEVVNLSRTVDGRGLIVHTTVGIGYEEPPDKVKAMLIEAARRTSDLKKSPKPFVLWSKLSDFAIEYQINAFSTRGVALPKILSDLHENIVAVFHENDTQIMTPAYETDPDEPKIPTKAWDGQLAKVI